MNMSFNPKDHLINLKGKDYLEVKWRLVWMRDVSPLPEGVHRIETDLVSYVDETAIVKAFFFVGDTLISTGYGTATKWKDRTIEKAETAAIGRALAIAGFGTQFDNEFEDNDNLADAPVKPQNVRKDLAKAQVKQTPTPAPKNAQNGAQGEDDPPFATSVNWVSFWKYTGKLGLTKDDVHDALKVDSAKDFTGTKSQAMFLIDAVASRKNKLMENAN